MLERAPTTDMPRIDKARGLREEERRTAERAVSVLINAGIAQSDRDALCRIRNLSESGIMVETRLPLTPDTDVSIQLRSGRLLDGTVRWRKDMRAGISFADVSADAILSDRPSVDGTDFIFPRFERRAGATVTVRHRRHRCTLSSLSLGDAVLFGLDGVAIGNVVTVAVEGLDDRLARIVRIEGDRAVVSFTEPLHFRSLERWLETVPVH